MLIPTVVEKVVTRGATGLPIERCQLSSTKEHLDQNPFKKGQKTQPMGQFSTESLQCHLDKDPKSFPDDLDYPHVGLPTIRKLTR